MSNYQIFEELDIAGVSYPVFDQPWQNLALATALVERMSLNYCLFNELTELGDVKVFKNIVGLCWEFAGGSNTSIDFDKQLLKLEEITPDPQQCDSYGVWPALDAAAALAALLSCCAKWEREEIIAIFKVSVATIEGYIELVDGEGLSDALHPLLVQEQQHIDELHALLALESDARQQRVKHVRQLVGEWGVSNIGLTLSA